ncbi:MAG: SDR family oxidoreductase [Alphaproteobacteria bacterium]|jgi:NAD(P)-dependent dehydrogenase (short-subunit alcohol dehydrogenase family)|nr:SDR family oxidoreductase [Alphaproteobacteria bacterium]
MARSETPSALVTGAARGIGRAIAARLAGDGWSVHMVDLDDELHAHADGLMNGGVRAYVADVADAAAVDRVVSAVERSDGRLDGLVANAGIMHRAPIEDLEPAHWDRVLAVNLTSTFLLARRARGLLAATRGGIVTIGSTRAHMSEPDTEAYAASKGGLVALTHALAVSLGPAIRVNCVSPGWIDTGAETLTGEDHAQHPAGRVGTPADVAALVAYLLGEESRFVTGAEWVVDGGMTRKMIYV